MKRLIKVLSSAIFFCIGSSWCLAQSSLKPLKIGTSVPEGIWQSIPKKKNTELVILDFWSTDCPTCIAAFPKMEKLQKEFNDKIQIVLVNTKQDAAKIKKEFEKINKNRSKEKQLGLPPSLPFMNAASSFQDIFPHKAVPHHVWINNNGNVLAITNGSNATKENVKYALRERRIELEYKVDFDEDKRMYIGEDWDIDAAQYEQWSLFKKGKIKGLEEVSNTRTDYRGYAIRNFPFIFLIRATTYTLGKTEEFKFCNDVSRTIIEVDDVDKIQWQDQWDKSKSKEEKEIWEQQNLYTYDILLPKSEVVADRTALGRQMIQDINRYSDYTCNVEKRKVKCLLLVRTSQTDKIKTKGGKSDFSTGLDKPMNISNMDYRYLIQYIKYNSEIKDLFDSLPFFDETNFKEKIDITFEKNPTNFKELKNELQRYDLDLVEAEREIDMFVVRDKAPIIRKSE